MMFWKEPIPFLLSALLLGMLPLGAGCGPNGDYGQVRGTVTLDGQPLPDALVEFIPRGESGVVSMGRTGQNGAYEMMFSRTGKGASVGENLVRITTHDVLDEGGREVRVPERVPVRYNRDTELSVNVQSGRNTFDFKLSTEGAVFQPAEVH